MYTKYFGLKESPFSISPDPRYLYMSELHREALAHLLYGISSDGCFILLTGDVGTGKTTVCRCLLQQLPDNTDVALIVNPRLTNLELLESICDELEISLGKGERSAKFYFDSINLHLLLAHAKGRKVALFIDEAQNLGLELLEQLRLLTNLETDQQKLLKIVLLGQSELREIVARDEAAQISQRITSRYHLLPLKEADVCAYIGHRLSVAGEQGKVFSKGALSKIFKLSCGIPRLVNVLCDRSMLGAYVEGKYLVTTKIVEQAGREVFGDEREHKEKRKKKSLLPLLLPVFFLCLAVYAVVLYWNQKRSIDMAISQAKQSAVSYFQKDHALQDDKSSNEKQSAVVVGPTLEENKDSIIRVIPLEINE